MALHEVDFRELKQNPYDLFDRRWAILAAGNENDGFNGMTIAWGTLGALWDKLPQVDFRGMCNPVATVYVRPSRHTKEFMDSEDLFTISVLPEELHHVHSIMGKKSGRDMDKFTASGITPAFENGTVHVAESELVLVCRKLYAAELSLDSFTDKEVVERDYPAGDVHVQYVGQIIKTLVK